MFSLHFAPLQSLLVWRALVSEARAAAAVCDAAACISTKCKGAKGNNIQTCNSGCQIDAAENKKKGLCKQLESADGNRDRLAKPHHSLRRAFSN